MKKFSFAYKRLVNKLILKFCISKINKKGEYLFLTFDDGPEPGITEFILNELDKYKFKGTFFCTGKNAELHPELIQLILKRGHLIGNHSYSHKHAYLLNAKAYIEDINKAKEVIPSPIFRPPNGCLLFSAWLYLRKKFKIIYWSIDSGDWRKESFNTNRSLSDLKRSKAGDIILFHFSQDLSKGTIKLLPIYLNWMDKNGYKSITLKEISKSH